VFIFDELMNHERMKPVTRAMTKYTISIKSTHIG